MFDQKGCLSPLVFYVKGDSRIYATRLAIEMERFNTVNPRGPLPPAESNSIRAAPAPTWVAAWLCMAALVACIRAC